MLETHGVDKGVLRACAEIIKINSNLQTKTTMAIGPEEKINEIIELVNEHGQENFDVLFCST